MRTVATIVSISLVLLFVILCIQEDGIFKFHPSLMAVSYLGFMFQAINIFSVDNTSRSSSISKRKQILIHSLFQVGSIICSIIAFTAIYLRKEQGNKSHFTSWHGLIGLTVFIWSLLQSTGGLLLTILQRYIRSLGLTHAKLLLGLASNWFKTKMPDGKIIYSGIFYLLTSSMLFLAHKCVEQVKARYVKRKIAMK
ncbi:unnamed protein product [Rotaria magnacalcarata]|nr:unnamed protein product [Rotaria magnacalcarata]CAF2134767.1 unnamed protein product [Rotaria magnacalcarata]